MLPSIKELREKQGYSQLKTAVLAGCVLNTWRIFEVAPQAVSPKKRAACEAVVAEIRRALGVAMATGERVRKKKIKDGKAAGTWVPKARVPTRENASSSTRRAASLKLGAELKVGTTGTAVSPTPLGTGRSR